jgi:hypothetical protein
MNSLEELIQELPPDLEQEVESAVLQSNISRHAVQMDI